MHAHSREESGIFNKLDEQRPYQHAVESRVKIMHVQENKIYLTVDDGDRKEKVLLPRSVACPPLEVGGHVLAAVSQCTD